MSVVPTRQHRDVGPSRRISMMRGQLGYRANITTTVGQYANISSAHTHKPTYPQLSIFSSHAEL